MRRYALLLAAGAAGLGILATVVLAGWVQTLARMEELARSASSWDEELQAEFSSLTALAATLDEVLPSLVIAAVIPAVGAIALTALDPRRRTTRRAGQAGSASVTASRDTSRS